MPHLRAEVISIGDEITSGVRLDTNTQWISQRLGNIGIHVAFHSTVGDELQDIVEVFRQAGTRAQVIVCTGGLGPTADDLTRQAIAEMAGVPLVLDKTVLQRIQDMFVRRGREMPSSNEIQAWFPECSNIIDNPEGTAPGIDFPGDNQQGSTFRIIALPGVPVEMKQMWQATVEPSLLELVGEKIVIHHHTIHCFGAGESHVESLLPDVVRRGRDPQVGITASSASISLRISTRGNSIEHCMEKMQPTVDVIENTLGDLVYGRNGQELQDIVAELLDQQNKTVAIIDAGLDGAVAHLIKQHELGSKNLLHHAVHDQPTMRSICETAADVARQSNTHFGIAIGSINRDPELVDAGNSYYQVGIFDNNQCHQKEFRFSGHSGWREVRAAKDVLNFLRLHLSSSPTLD